MENINNEINNDVMNYIASNVYKIKYYFLHTYFRHNFNVYVSCKECINIY